MEPSNRKITEGCLVLVINAATRPQNIGKIATAVRQIFEGDIINLGGRDFWFDPKPTSNSSPEYWVIEGEGLEASTTGDPVFGACIAKSTSLLPIYPEEDDQYLEELIKEKGSCEA